MDSSLYAVGKSVSNVIQQVKTFSPAGTFLSSSTLASFRSQDSELTIKMSFGEQVNAGTSELLLFVRKDAVA